MAVFGRVLEATRANLKVLNRLRELKAARLEYREQAWAAENCGWNRTEDGRGNS